MTNLRCRSILATNIGFSLSDGGKGRRNFYAVTWPSISRDAEQATAKGNHQCQSKVRFHAVGQEKKGRCIGRKQESIFESEAWSRRGPTFRVIDKTQILCFAGFYTGGSDGPPRDQVGASFYLFSFKCSSHENGWLKHIPELGCSI